MFVLQQTSLHLFRMTTIPAQTIKLQDGSLFNFRRRFKRHHRTLLSCLQQIPDLRRDQGKRHALAAVLLLVFSGIFAQYSQISDIWRYGITHRKWLKKYVDLPHGIACETTISRVLAGCDLEGVTKAFLSWLDMLVPGDRSASFDGKTMRGVHGEEVIRHILSVFTHQTKQVLGQEGVDSKENEIPAAQRLLEKVQIKGLMLVADALHAQKETVKQIIKAEADYLVYIKGNQKHSLETLAANFADPRLQVETYQSSEYQKGRSITTTVRISHDLDLEELQTDWPGVRWIGQVYRCGTRMHQGKETVVDETVYFICSRQELTAQQTARFIRSHWGIENHLHWQKDWTFHEDRHTLRSGVAPQVMTLLRSVCISVCHAVQVASVTQTLKTLQINPQVHHRFLAAVSVI
jgi:predicted transposase YbfD/YdcC